MQERRFSLRITIAITTLLLWSTPSLHTQELPDVDLRSGLVADEGDNGDNTESRHYTGKLVHLG